MTNETHAPDLESWVPDAQDGATDFPVQNLPYGVFRRTSGEAWRIGVAIGSQVLDLAAATRAGLLGSGWEGVQGSSLNALMSQGPERWRAL